jgi:hypothetical protein
MTLIGPVLYLSETQYKDDSMVRNCIDLISQYEFHGETSDLDHDEINFNALDRLDVLCHLDVFNYLPQPSAMKMEYAPFTSLLCRNDHPKRARARTYDILI